MRVMKVGGVGGSGEDPVGSVGGGGAGVGEGGVESVLEVGTDDLGGSVGVVWVEDGVWELGCEIGVVGERVVAGRCVCGCAGQSGEIGSMGARWKVGDGGGVRGAEVESKVDDGWVYNFRVPVGAGPGGVVNCHDDAV